MPIYIGSDDYLCHRAGVDIIAIVSCTQRAVANIISVFITIGNKCNSFCLYLVTLV